LKITAVATALAIACTGFAGASQAGAFSVTPVRIYMGPKDRAVAVTIVNEGDSDIALQADVNLWSQGPDGTDKLELTEDLIVSPPILKLAPRARQVVRLALVAPRDASRQLTYRLLVREVPEAAGGKPATVQLPIALVLNMPVFITPPGAKRQVACDLARGTASKDLEAVCENSGNAYAQVREIDVKRGDRLVARFEGSTYVLPGAKRSIRLQAAEGVPAAAGPAQMQVTFDDPKPETFAVALP
jgi:fimbrial chaperone protein